MVFCGPEHSCLGSFPFPDNAFPEEKMQRLDGCARLRQEITKVGQHTQECTKF